MTNKNLIQQSVIKAVSDGPVTLLKTGGEHLNYKLSCLSPQYIRKRRYILGKLSGYTAIPDPTCKLNLSPTEINLYRSRGYSSAQEYWEEGGYWKAGDEYNFDKWSDLGAIHGGEWDIQNLDLTQLPKYVGMKEHFIHNIPWKETSLFEYYRGLLNDDVKIDGCSSEAELLNRYTKIEKMCLNIQSEGYKSRNEICDEGDFQCLMDEVTVSIGRNGQFIFGDGGGWHRLCIAKLFSIDIIPVKVLVRHAEWQEVRERIYKATTVDELNSSLAAYLDHPDIVDCV